MKGGSVEADAADAAITDRIYDALIDLRPNPAALDALRSRLGASAVQLDYAVVAGSAPTMSVASGAPSPDASGAVLRAEGEGWRLACYGSADQLEFEELARHVRRAMRLRDRLLGRGAAAFGFSDLAERLGIGALLTRPDGRIRDASAQARAILQEADGLFVSGGRLCAAAAPEMSDLKRLLRAVAEGERESGALAVTRPSGRQDLGLVIRRASPMAEVGEADLVVSLRSSEGEVVRAPETLRALYGFTLTEAELAADLVNGLSAEEVEAARGISHNTMRAHLRSIYAKVGVGRLVDLVRVVASGGAPLAPDRP